MWWALLVFFRAIRYAGLHNAGFTFNRDVYALARSLDVVLDPLYDEKTNHELSGLTLSSVAFVCTKKT